jgi:exonuclease I
MPKPNFIFFDTETSGGRGLADILTIDALYYDYNFNLIGEFSCKARLRKSRVYEVDAFMVNNLDPFELDQCSNSNFDLTKQTYDTFTKWTNKNETFFCAHNGYGFDYMLTSQHLFSNLHSWPWIFSTGNARQLDSLPIVQNFDFYSPNKIKFEINEKNNKIYRLGSLCKANGFEIKNLHSSRGDTEGLAKLMALLREKDPSLFRQSLSFTNKQNVLENIKAIDYFCHPETFYGRTRQFASSYLCEHPQFKNYHLVFDLKHDPELIFQEKSNKVLEKTLNGAPKKYRTIKVGKNPFIQDKSFATKFDDEYAKLGHEVLQKRAHFIMKNRKEIAERICLIINDKFEEQTIDQTELIPEQMIFNLNPSSNDKTLMNKFVMTNDKDEQKRIHKNFDGPLKHLSEMILLDKYDKDGFDSKEEYRKVRKNISRRLLSTNKEVFPTIPEGMARIDTLREEKKDDKIGLEKVERINSHLEKLASEHESYL